MEITDKDLKKYIKTSNSFALTETGDVVKKINNDYYILKGSKVFSINPNLIQIQKWTLLRI